MSVAAIVCEYNPFHRGHEYQLRALREREPEAAVVCLMSGNYVQRGEPAVYDKWFRAGTAAERGADLVLELPLTVAVSSAGYFAAGAVDCLAALGCVDTLCFGSENGDAESLSKTACLMNTPEYDAALGDILTGGMSFAAARTAALEALGGDGALLASPNSALGVDYLRRLYQRGSSIRPLVIPRDGTLPTATELRGLLAGRGGGEAPVHTLQNGERAMLAVLRTLPDSAFEAAPLGSEGLWRRAMTACRREDTVAEILAACKSKRYAMSRLKRMLLCLYLGLSRADMEREIPYLRVLAFNERGRALLHDMKRTAALPLVAGDVPKTPRAREYFALECRATDLYGLFAPQGIVEPAGMEKTAGPVYLQKVENTESALRRK